MNYFSYVLFLLFFAIICIAPVVWFIVSLVMLIKHKNYPYNRKSWRNNLIASSIVISVIFSFLLFIGHLGTQVVSNM